MLFRRRLGELLFGSAVRGRAAVANYRIVSMSRVGNLSSLCTPSKPQCASFSSGSSSSSSYSAKGPSQQLKSWESGARMVQNTTVENKYLEHIREVHDPSQHLKTIEDELKGTIGKALGKQGQKVLLYARLMDEQRQKHANLVAQLAESSQEQELTCKLEDEIEACAVSHNEYRKECLHARWELIVHRQAVGFIVGNHKYVTEKFPIAEALPVQEDNLDESSSGGNQKTQEGKKTFTDQLDWWQRIGRWK